MVRVFLAGVHCTSMCTTAASAVFFLDSETASLVLTRGSGLSPFLRGSKKPQSIFEKPK
jgi:hypothetical protein